MMRQVVVLTILVSLIGLSSQFNRKTCANLYADDCTSLPCCTPGPFGPITCQHTAHGRRCFYSASVTTQSPRCFLKRCNSRDECCERHRFCLFRIPRIQRGFCF